MGVRHIILVGGGHAHVAVIADWIRNGVPAEHATLITPYPTLRYSGMVPGWISGQYSRNEGVVDVAALAKRAGIQLILDRCAGIDPEARTMRTEAGEDIGFDLCSIDTGGVGRAADVLGDDPRILDVRPIERFVDRIEALPPAEHIAVIGGGAGGVELAFGLRNRGAEGSARITFVIGAGGLLPDFHKMVRAKVAAELARQSIQTIEADARIENGVLFAGDVKPEGVGAIVAAIGSGAPSWPRDSGLECDARGFIAVDRYQRSTSHPHIYAVGDAASRQDRSVPHSGVHAVFAGPVLADNLRASAAGIPPSRTYRPRFTNLYLMSTARGEAIASYGPFSGQGRWAARLKHWIDTRWLNQYARLSGTSGPTV